MSGTLYCSSDLITEGGVPVCNSNWVVVPYSPPFDPSQLDPVVASQMLALGFSVTMPLLAAVIGIRIFLTFLNKHTGGD